jgi:hypothetical protein
MAQGGNLGVRITDLIGSEYSTIPTNAGDLINSAINEVADMMSEDLLLKHSRTPGVLEANTEWLVENRKILKVTRIDADSSGIERECRYFDRAAFSVAQDSSSIHYATVYSPVYHLDSANAGAATLKIMPVPTTPQKGKIWYFQYVTGATPDVDITDLDETTINTEVFLPSNSMHAIALKSSINILQAYISDFVQNEEDSEMLQMIQAQLQGLKAEFQQEIARFMDESGRPGAE